VTHAPRHLWTGLFSGIGNLIRDVPEAVIAVTTTRTPRIRPPGKRESALLRLGTSAATYSCSRCGTERLLVLGRLPFAWLDDGFKSGLFLACSDNCASKYARKQFGRRGRVGRC
jgi:hypothetical protein